MGSVIGGLFLIVLGFLVYSGYFTPTLGVSGCTVSAIPFLLIPVIGGFILPICAIFASLPTIVGVGIFILGAYVTVKK